MLKPAELPALCNVVSSTCIYQQFVPHFALSPLIVVCGIASERLALTAGFKAVLDDEGKSLDASLSNSDTLSLVPSFIFTDDTSKNKMAADDELGRARPRKIK